MRWLYFSLFLIMLRSAAFAQNVNIAGNLSSSGTPIPFANIFLEGTSIGAASDQQGNFLIEDVRPGKYSLHVSAVGYAKYSQNIVVSSEADLVLNITLRADEMNIGEVVVTGTLKEVSRLESPVPVEVYSPAFFKLNPTPSLFDAMQNINGVRPQLNCNVCNTGDIHINGLEGPYTMILIDGMPIVSGLSSVYGLSGIPNSIIQRIEIVKGPASSLYGSEAVGGLINVITKDPSDAPLFSADIMASSWQEINLDLGYKFTLGSNVSVLTGLNYFNYSQPIDNNDDNFTDVTLQDRISVFQKWNFKRKNNRKMSVAGRFLYEDRWGGEMQWNSGERGGDEVYGESIYTKRWEIVGQYQLPVSEKLLLSVSYNDHMQNSYYGQVPFMADQKIGFGQLSLDKTFGNHDLLIGTAIRYTHYDDNTTATAKEEEKKIINDPDIILLPGLFLQDEIELSKQQKFLLGIRYDYNSLHGNIFTPRLAYKFSLNDENIFRLNAGTGFRVVNLFTEEHASLTGSRAVVIEEELDPERSYNVNLNYIRKIHFPENVFLDLETTVWHTYFMNQILPDYDTDPDKIIYGNLDGHAVTQGVSLNMDLTLLNGLKILLGGTFMDVYTVDKNELGNSYKRRPMLTEKWSGTWAITFPFDKLNLSFNYTGNLYGPMRLPVLGDLDPRPEYSSWWSLQNVQLTWKRPGSYWEIFGGIKNILNFTPPDNSIARANDPFDKEVVFDVGGKALATANNPYALTFDPSYVFAPNQGIRGFIGVRMSIDEKDE